MNLAGQEASAVITDTNEGSRSLVRQLYLHGLTYLLRGLPNNLSAEEKMSVCAAVPDEVVALRTTSFQSTELIHLKTSTVRGIRNGQPGQRPSVLQRVLAAMIVQMFLIAQFLLPYIKVCMAAAYRYERKYRITERVVSFGVSTVDGAMKRSMDVSNNMYCMNEGKVGQALNDFAIWWLQGVSAGIRDGVAEGLLLTGFDPSKSVDGKGKNAD